MPQEQLPKEKLDKLEFEFQGFERFDGLTNSVDLEELHAGRIMLTIILPTS